MNRLKEIELRLKNATPGPWKPDHAVPAVYPDQERGANTKWKRVCTIADREVNEEVSANTEFIVHSHEDIACLLELVKVYSEALEFYADCDNYLISAEFDDGKIKAKVAHRDVHKVAIEALTQGRKIKGES
jgi:hypothetical protein